MDNERDARRTETSSAGIEQAGPPDDDDPTPPQATTQSTPLAMVHDLFVL